MREAITTRVWGIFVKIANARSHAGHARLFHSNGPMVFTYLKLSDQPEWAIERAWLFWLFAIRHIGEGKATSDHGWHFVPGKLKLTKLYNGFQLTWHKPDIYGSIHRKKAHGRHRRHLARPS